ncbi:MAG: hypothetical protein JSU98_15245 [Gemmatimonadales bacterium]|nr:MAG: hypothetical protein JSU98_15245 [Gemmatimonadales bacterium]
MIKYRKPNRVRDVVGAIVFAVAAALLWVQSSMAGSHVDSAALDEGGATATAVIRSATGGSTGCA